MKKISEHTIIGIAACAGVYLFVFVYLQVSSFTGFGKKTTFNTYSKLEDDGVRLKAENIDAESFSGGDVSSISRDVNDSRNSSADDWSESTYEGDPAESAKDIEQQFIDETGGDEKRESVAEEREEPLSRCDTSKHSQTERIAGWVVAPRHLAVGSRRSREATPPLAVTRVPPTQSN